MGTQTRTRNGNASLRQNGPALIVLASDSCSVHGAGAGPQRWRFAANMATLQGLRHVTGLAQASLHSAPVAKHELSDSTVLQFKDDLDTSFAPFQCDQAAVPNNPIRTTPRAKTARFGGMAEKGRHTNRRTQSASLPLADLHERMTATIVQMAKPADTPPSNQPQKLGRRRGVAARTMPRQMPISNSAASFDFGIVTSISPQVACNRWPRRLAPSVPGDTRNHSASVIKCTSFISLISLIAIACAPPLSKSCPVALTYFPTKGISRCR